MPCPVDLYQGPASFSISMRAACQRLISAMCVPDLSPREMKSAPLALITCSAKMAFLEPLIRGIVLRSDNDKIVVHHGIAFHAKAFRNKFLFCLLGMRQHHVGLAAAPHVERLAGAMGDDFNVDAALLLEQGKNKIEEPGILGRSRRGNHNGFFLRRSKRHLRKREGSNPNRDQRTTITHV